MGLSLSSSTQLSGSGPEASIGIERIDRGLVLLPHCFIDFLSEYPDFPWRGNAEPDLVAAHTDHGHDNIVADRDALPKSATQYQHRILLSEKAEETRLAYVSICWEGAVASHGAMGFF